MQSAVPAPAALAAARMRSRPASVAAAQASNRMPSASARSLSTKGDSTGRGGSSARLIGVSGSSAADSAA